MSQARAWLILVLGLAMAFVGPPLVFFSGKRKAEEAAALRREGRPIEARVVGVRQRLRKSDRITFAFVVDGREATTTEDAERATTERYREGDAIPVLYLPRDPDVATHDLNRMESSAATSTSWGPWGVAGIGLLAAASGIFRLRKP